jgi:N-acetylglucosamine kinase-like BadF-type ATPase
VEKYFFGIDGGGTRSRIALINSAGETLAYREEGGTNIYSAPESAVFENLAALLNGALRQAGIGRAMLAGGCIGSAGLARPRETALFRGWFDSLLGADVPVKLCTDGEILLAGGLDGPEGYCLIAGTGSLALARSNSGELLRAGGFGYLLGDEGAGAWIGKSAAARTLRSGEGRDLPTKMGAALLSACKLGASEDLIPYLHRQAGKAEAARLAPLVTEAARGGDALALDILRRGAEELALLVRSLLTRTPHITNRTLVLAGGVIEHDEILRGHLLRLLAAEAPDLAPISPRRSALEGACLLAASAGLNPRV